MALENLQAFAKKRVPELQLIRRGSEGVTYTHVSTGVFIIDFALLGGFPENCAITLVGKPHSGKTTLAYKTIGNFQKKYDGSSEDRPKKYCVFVDVERGFNKAWAAANGVDTEDLFVITPTNAEEAVDLAAAAMEDDDVCLVVFDSIPALVGGKELDKSAEDALAPGSVAVHANRMMRKVSHAIAKAHNEGKKKTMININQWRDGIGSSPHMPRTMPGGKYVRHYASIELEIYNDKQITGKDGNEVTVIDHNLHSFKIHKNRAGSSIIEGEYKMLRNTVGDHTPGYVDDGYTVTTYAQKFGLVGGAGQGWWLADPETGEVLQEEDANGELVDRKFKSKGLVQEYIENNLEFRESLTRKVVGLHRRKQGLSVDGWW